ncbi:hypothetical protein [Rhizobium leguminosarum]
MGNHDVGRGMAAGARGFWIGNGDREVDQARALEAMDAIASDYHRSDAEFDDELSTDTELSRLMLIAFDGTEQDKLLLKGELPDDADEDAAWDAWYEGAYSRFRERYRFC